MIRDHTTPGSSVTGVHSRLVLLWQSSVEADLYCADELTALQAKVNGLLEVTALTSGDTTRCNIPENTFRRAIARLMSKGVTAGLVSGRARGRQRHRGRQTRQRRRERHRRLAGQPAPPPVRRPAVACFGGRLDSHPME
ncbi:unnamed protein product [Ectocarpus sp. 4 AP-2014]